MNRKSVSYGETFAGLGQEINEPGQYIAAGALSAWRAQLLQALV